MTNTNDIFYIIVMGLLIIAFFPQLYLFLLFVTMIVVDLVEYIVKLMNKFIEKIVTFI